VGRPRRLGLALGGGGARGLAHVGFLQVLAEAGLEVACLSGTSMGALVGAGLALGFSAGSLEETYWRLAESDLFKRARLDLVQSLVEKPESDNLYTRLSWLAKRYYAQGLMLTRNAVLDLDFFRELIAFFLPQTDFSQAKIPFACAALELTRGRTQVFTRGSLFDAVCASAALPGFVPPVPIEGRLYCDGGPVMIVPVTPLRDLGAEVTVAVDVDTPIEDQDEFRNLLEVIVRATEASSWLLKETQLEQADLVVRPEVSHCHWSDFKWAETCLQAGREAGLQRLPEIRDLIRRRWRLGWFKA